MDLECDLFQSSTPLHGISGLMQHVSGQMCVPNMINSIKINNDDIFTVVSVFILSQAL